MGHRDSFYSTWDCSQKYIWWGLMKECTLCGIAHNNRWPCGYIPQWEKVHIFHSLHWLRTLQHNNCNIGNNRSIPHNFKCCTPCKFGLLWKVRDKHTSLFDIWSMYVLTHKYRSILQNSFLFLILLYEFLTQYNSPQWGLSKCMRIH